MRNSVITRPLGSTSLNVTPIGFGSFKIGRNQKTKYPLPYDLPDEESAMRLLNAILDMGINFIDTAPAYGFSEERIGKSISHRRDEFVLSTKVGETFQNGESEYDFSDAAVRNSVHRSLQCLNTEIIDLIFIHSNGDDLRVLNETDVVATLHDLKNAGKVRAIGFSGKTVAGARASLGWADLIMVEYHVDDPSHGPVINAARQQNVGVVVKKGLASGRLTSHEAIQFVLSDPGVTSLVVGGLNLEHMRSNLETASRGITVSAESR